MAVALRFPTSSTAAPKDQPTPATYMPHATQDLEESAEPDLDPFHSLVRSIRTYLGSSSGIDSADIDVDYLKGLMNRYVSNPDDWKRYAYADPSKHYTRNCVEDINGKANILILVWNPKKGSPVHDHANAHCVMKVLQGKLKEELFDMPASSSSEHAHHANAPLELKKETILGLDQVAYVSDNIGLHRISNPAEDGELAVSLHLYTPPNAADFGYHIYDEKTGKSVFVNKATARRAA
ncbi:hypothetical protein BP6252_06869 [Coleophoma cylindrospora]|uniref:Cysteine dioxygenase n=1 Tax=Coleophoma cylindrospora TaxID=1849047 RepID=A0A3D8RFZ8_9HELO|nr:hypothetical protein BP6252_06869 [Coleophoma cylindrospora]